MFGGDILNTVLVRPYAVISCVDLEGNDFCCALCCGYFVSARILHVVKADVVRS